MTWSGLYTPLITPFKNGQLDEEGLKTLIYFQKERGVEGLVFLGTTGEASTLSHKEKERILTIAQKEIGDLHFIVGTGAPSTQMTIENTHQAADYGADAVLIITPYFNNPTQEGLIKHYEKIAVSTSLPIIVYNNPGRTGVNIETSTLAKIAEISLVEGIKFSSKNFIQLVEIMALIKSQKPSFSILCGEDALLLPILSLGADGAIAAAANIAPKPIQQCIQAALSNDYAEASRLFYLLTPLFKALSIETNPIPHKYAMQQLGLPAGDPRLPLTSLSSCYRKSMDSVLDKSLFEGAMR